MIGVNIVGFKNSGKTGLALTLGKELRSRGLRIAALKHSHHTGPTKHSNDGDMLSVVFNATAVITRDETVLYRKGSFSAPDILPLLSADVVIVEGGKSFGWLPRILCLRAPQELNDLHPELALAVYHSEHLDLSDDLTGPAAIPGEVPIIHSASDLVDMILEKGFTLSGLDCGACGRESCTDLSRDILNGRARPQDCLAGHGDVTVRIDGAELPMKPFVQNIFKGAVLGMLAELKGGRSGNVEISITPEPSRSK